MSLPSLGCVLRSAVTVLAVIASYVASFTLLSINGHDVVYSLPWSEIACGLGNSVKSFWRAASNAVMDHLGVASKARKSFAVPLAREFPTWIYCTGW